MLKISRTGPSMADVISELRGLRTSVLPYAAATALTRCAKLGQASVISQMRSSFANPVPYTLNATRIEVARKDSLTARIAVKDVAGRGTRPESYLLPEVEGGGRSEKGFERAMRLAGLMLAGERAMPGAGVQRDGPGNVSGATVRTILRQATRSGKASKAGVFVGAIGKRQTRGVWERVNGRVRPLFIFTRSLPNYRPRLDFSGAVEAAVRENYATEFYKAAQSMQARSAA